MVRFGWYFAIIAFSQKKHDQFFYMSFYFILGHQHIVVIYFKSMYVIVIVGKKHEEFLYCHVLSNEVLRAWLAWLVYTTLIQLQDRLTGIERM